jgi:alkanesulfonate monooxygenase SsuD/methylene tetrahydromethanopterin reductase-like flavin-dependent oxidoreductase (luciferase family)
VTRDRNGELLSQPRSIHALVREGVAAEESGLDFFGLGEHHVEEMPLSAPDIVWRPSPVRPPASGSARPLRS